jgi:pimeloyl-ACP methyl ester carboxylesterase
MDRDLYVIDQGRGPNVLALHGQPGLAADWEYVLPHLVGDHRVVVPDRPGYGASEGVAVGMAANAKVLAELIEDRGLAPVTVVGHSYGGGIGILLAASRPDLIGGLVLVGSVGRSDSLNFIDHVLGLPWAGEALTAAGLLALGRALPYVRELAVRLPGRRMAWLQATLPDRHYAKLGPRFGRQVRKTFVVEQRALVREIGAVESALPRIHLPTVVIVGTWDVVVPPSVGAVVAGAVPGAELVTLARTGHFVPRDAPLEIADAVRRVEARASAPGGSSWSGTDIDDTGT